MPCKCKTPMPPNCLREKNTAKGAEGKADHLRDENDFQVSQSTEVCTKNR